jgi:hypothetical protein
MTVPAEAAFLFQGFDVTAASGLRVRAGRAGAGSSER